MLQAFYVPMLTTDKQVIVLKNKSDVGSPVHSYSNEKNAIFKLSTFAFDF